MCKLILILFFYTPVDTTTIVLDSAYTENSLNKILQKARKTRDHYTLANVYFKLGEYEENIINNNHRAFDYYTRSLDYYKLIKDTMQLNVVKERIAVQYVKSGLYDDAIDGYTDLIQYYKEKGDVYQQTKLVGKVSDIYLEKGDTEKKIEYLELSKRLNRSLQDTTFMIENMHRTVLNFIFLNELDTARSIASRSLSLSLIANKPEFVSKSLFHLGDIFGEKRDYKKAEAHLQRSLEYASSRPYNENKLNTYNLLQNAYDKLGDYKKAYLFARRYELLKDSIMDHDRLIEESKIAIQYRTEENKREIQNLEKKSQAAEEKTQAQKRTVTLLTIGLGLLSLAIYYIISFYTQRIKASKIINQQKNQISDQKIRELEDNLKISSMQSMIEGQEVERERIAKDLHDSLGGLLSTIKLQFDSVQSKVKTLGEVKEYQNANKLIDAAVEEVRTISRNLQPGAMKDLGLIASLKDLFNRVDGKHYPEVTFQYFDFPDKIDNMKALSIYRIIQELLNNAIKHSKAKEILVQLSRQEQELVILFEDDGVGFNPDKLQRKGMGLENIQSRVNYLKGNLHIDSQIGKGTTFLIHIDNKDS